MEIEDVIEKINNQSKNTRELKSNNLLKTILSILFSLFCWYLIFDFDISFSGAFVFTLFVHELGHYVMAKIYSFTNVHMRFIGPLGAYVSGVSKNNSNSENFWFYIMGPLPGLFICACLFFTMDYWESDFIMGTMIIMFFLNAFNLIPVGFLDGGKLFNICLNSFVKARILLSILFFFPFFIMLYYDLVSSYNDGEIYWLVYTVFLIVVFGVQLYFQIFNFKNNNIVIKESQKLSHLLIQRHGYIPNYIDYENASFIIKNLKQYKNSNIKIEDIWNNRSVPLNSYFKLIYSVIYISIISLSVLTYITFFTYPQDGRSEFTLFNGSIYDGEWKKGQYHGQGVMNYRLGTTYNGEWKDGDHHGLGVKNYASGTTYNGGWKDGEHHGLGVKNYASGTTYNGGWKDGEHHGQGVLTYNTGTTYDGEWKDGELHGQGVLTYNSGPTYDGEWKDGLEDGQGVLTYVDGSSYYGGWKEGMKYGQGVLTYNSDTTYDGEWKDGEHHGLGVKNYASGTTYNGGWKDGLEDGQGVLTNPNGTIYDGEWKEGEYHGMGSFLYPVYLEIDSPKYLDFNYYLRKVVSDSSKDINNNITGNLELINEGVCNNEKNNCCEIKKDLFGKIALISRGTCLFNLKISNAIDANAKGIIIYNNKFGMMNINSGLSNLDIPVYFMGKQEGNILKNYLLQNGSVKVNFTQPPSYSSFNGKFRNGEIIR